MSSEAARPFKVWSNDRHTKKSLVARSLEEIKTKGKEKLGYQAESVTVHLEDDGTEVEEEEYFSALRDNTVLLLLRDGEAYCKPWETGKDETDYVSAAGTGDADHVNTLVYDVTRKLRHDLATLVTLTEVELQCLIDVDVTELCAHLNCTMEETEQLQEACQRYVDEKQDAAEAVRAIQLLKDWATSAEKGKTEPDSKRKKAS